MGVYDVHVFHAKVRTSQVEDENEGELETTILRREAW